MIVPAPRGIIPTPEIDDPSIHSMGWRAMARNGNRKKARKKDSPRRHEEKRREESGEEMLVASDSLLLRFLLRVFVPLW
jgi:hypothetical protein